MALAGCNSCWSSESARGHPATERSCVPHDGAGVLHVLFDVDAVLVLGLRDVVDRQDRRDGDPDGVQREPAAGADAAESQESGCGSDGSQSARRVPASKAEGHQGELVDPEFGVLGFVFESSWIELVRIWVLGLVVEHSPARGGSALVKPR